MTPAPPPLLGRALAGLAVLGALGCAPEPDVVIYCALDQVHSEPLLARFEAETGLRVRAEFDVEQHKTVGLVRRLREERGNPRCDVFWNNEVANTIALAEEGMLASYASPSAADIPAAFKDPEQRWTGFAARARVFIVNTELVPDASEIDSMWDLVDPRWQGKVGMAKPLTGTTLTHFAALYETIGPAETERYVREIKAAGVNLARGNAHTMKLVASGELAFAWTDSDDFNVALENGAPVIAVYPDQEPRGAEPALGTLVIPNSVAILADAPHPEAARRLVDWILSPEIERELAFSRSAQIPVRAGVECPPHVRRADDFAVMQVDYARVGSALAERLETFNVEFND